MASAAVQLEEEDELRFEDLAKEMERFGLHEWLEVEDNGQHHEDTAATATEGLFPLPVAVGVGPRRERDLYGPDELRFPGDHLGRGHAHALHNFPGAGSVPPHAAWPSFSSDAYMTPPWAWPGRSAAINIQLDDYIVYLAKNEQMVLDTLFSGSPEDAQIVADLIVRYAVHLLESSHGNRLLDLVLNHCNDSLHGLIVARITPDKNRFFRICGQRSDEVARVIRSCRSVKSLQLLRNAIMPWIAPSMMHQLVTDSNRLRVVQAFVQCVPDPYFAKFIFDAIAKNCLALAYGSHGVSLLRSCLEHAEWTEKDDVLSKISCWSIELAQNRFGNYIVQDVLKQRNPSHLAIIASCFRNNYVLLSKQRYSSNVVETCLQVFVDAERFFIIDELIWCPHFKDLVTHEFANYVISRALRTCTFPLQHRLATAILSLQNVNRRHPHCLKMFKILSDLGYRH